MKPAPSIEDEFPVKKRCVYCNNAAVAPLPASTSFHLKKWLDEYVEAGTLYYSQWMERIKKTRQDFASFLKVKASEIAFVKNTSTGISFLANGYDFSPGDEIVVFEKEFPSNLYPWLSLEEKGVKVKVVPERNYAYNYDEWLFLLTPRTRLCAVSFVDYATGFRHNLQYLGRECAKRGIIFAVDAIQGLGVLPLDVRNCSIDFLCADGHKWLLSPEGCAVMYIKKSLIPHVKPITLGWNSVCHSSDFETIRLDLKADAARFEEGSPNVFGILALSHSLALLRRVGIEKIASKVTGLTDYLRENISTQKYESYSRQEEPSCIVNFKPLHKHPQEVYRKLMGKKIFGSVRRNGIRFSPHFYNDLEEMERIVDILNGIE